LIVTRAAISIASCPLPPAKLGQSYQQTMEVVGGTAPYLWTIEGALPSGLTLSNAGILRGTPASAGNSTFNLRVDDSRGLSATRSCSIGVEPETLLVESACPLPAARVASAYQQRLTARGGIGPYSWSVRGSLPEGLALESDGTFSGSPTAAGDYRVTVIVTDSGGRRAVSDCALPVRLPDLPAMRLSGLAPVLAPATSNPTVSVELASVYPLAINGELSVSITPETGSTEGEINRPFPSRLPAP
jgi:hypothetical protein